jgi:membrane protease YdiL (CAAX protease family)
VSADRVGPRVIRWRYVAPPLGAAVALACIEVVIAQGQVLAGQAADALLVLLLVNIGGGARDPSRSAQADAAVAAMRSLALVALIRALGIGLPLHHWTRATSELLLAALVGFAAIRLGRLVGGTPRMLMSGGPLTQLGAVVGGFVLGLGAYLLGAPAILPAGASASRWLLAIAGATAAAAVEELVFRGLVQLSLRRVAGRAGLLAATALFATTYLGLRSTSLVLLVALAGLLFAYAVNRTGALGGAVAGHIMLAVGAGALWPALLGFEHRPSLPGPAATIVLAVAVATTAVLVLRYPAAPNVLRRKLV